jgi:hypothetical protein
MVHSPLAVDFDARSIATDLLLEWRKKARPATAIHAPTLVSLTFHSTGENAYPVPRETAAITIVRVEILSQKAL